MSELEFMQEHYSFGPQIVDSVVVEATKALLQGGIFMWNANMRVLPLTGFDDIIVHRGLQSVLGFAIFESQKSEKSTTFHLAHCKEFQNGRNQCPQAGRLRSL